MREIWAGIRYVTEIPWLWVTITLFAFVLMFQWAPIQVLTPKLVREHFHLGVRAYGLIFQSTDNSVLEQNEITQNAVGL